MNYMNCSNVSFRASASNVDSLQENNDVRLIHSCNDEENIINIINLLIKTSTLEKEKSKDHSWKKIALRLIQRLRRNLKKKNHADQDVFIAKNVQKLKASV